MGTITQRSYPRLVVRGGPAGHQVVVRINDRTIERVVGLKLEAQADGIVKATIEFYAEADVDVIADEVTRRRKDPSDP